MNKNESILIKSLNTVQTIQKENERIDYILYVLKRLINAEKTLFFIKQQIPKRGLARYAWQNRTPFYINNIKKDERFNPKYDSYCENIYAALYYPVKYNDSHVGMIIGIGKEGYTTTQEQIVPLKSGDRTIGVTVKQATVDVPPEQFSQEDIATLDQVLPHFLEVHYGTSETKQSLPNKEAITTEENMGTEEKSSILEAAVNKMKKLFNGNN